MKKSSTIFLQVVVVLLGIGALAVMLWEPHLEGRNARATNFDIYFKDPFLAWAYSASLAFFMALYQAFKLLGYAGQNKIFSPEAVKALRTIKYCAMIIVGFIAPAEVYLFIVRPGDDIAGGVFIGVLISLISITVAVVAAIFARRLQSAVNVKSDNHSLPNTN